jgi:hypothetical protein
MRILGGVDMLNLASVTALTLSPVLKTLGPLMVPAMTWFPVTKLQVVAPEVLHTEPLWAFGGTNGCVPPQVPPPLVGGTAGYWAVRGR